MNADTTPSTDGRTPRVVARETPFRGRLITVRVDRLQPANGGDEVVREVVVHPGAVAVVALPSPGSVLLVCQYRHPAGRDLWEIPAGKLERGESPLACAQRELEEETGHRASAWTPLVTAFTTPGFSTETLALFRADGLARTERVAEDRDVDDCREFSVQQLQQMLGRGDLVDAKTLLGLLWSGLLRGTPGSVTP